MKKILILSTLLLSLSIFIPQVSALELEGNDFNETTIELYEKINPNTENKFVKYGEIVENAISEYNAGLISEEEYLLKIQEVSTFLETESNYEILKADAEIVNSAIQRSQSSCTTGGSGVIEYDLFFGSFTAQEIWLVATHPINSAEANRLAGIATSATHDKYSRYTHWQGNGDAFRHAYWSALMTKHISRDFAYDAGLAHEGLSRGYDFDSLGADSKMDVSNNYSGRQYGTTYGNLNDGTIANIVRNMVSYGNLKRIRSYTSVASRIDCYLNNVPTKYEGYYVNTSTGGLL